MLWMTLTPRLGALEKLTSLFNQARPNKEPLHERVEAFLRGGLRIDGHVTGDVVVAGVEAGTLTIGNGGVVEGNVRVSHLIVYGHISGNVNATGLVNVWPEGRVMGDVHYGSLEMAAGAVIRGRLIGHTSGTAY
jgi:cytoskeletal protein CcmA (bactofilin family)